MLEAMILEDLKIKKHIERLYSHELNALAAQIQDWINRVAKNNGLTYASALKMLNKAEMDDFKMTVDEYIALGMNYRPEWKKRLENASARVHISWLDSMSLQMRQHAEKLGLQLETLYADEMRDALDMSVYANMSAVSGITGMSLMLDGLNEEEIEIALTRPWMSGGKTFSESVWGNIDKLERELDNVLIGGTIRGDDYNNMADNLARAMNRSRNSAYTLISTERAAMASIADKKMYESLDTEEFQVVATLDMKTCDSCGSMDGRRESMKRYRVGLTAPPFHPRCRCTTVPYIDDEFEREFKAKYGRIARDSHGKSVYIKPGMTFTEWKASSLRDFGR